MLNRLVDSSLVPRPSTPPVFDRLQYTKMEGEGLGNFITWSVARLSYVVTPPFNSQVMHETNLTFCASYEDGTSTSRELHQAYETYPGYKPGIQKATKWQVWKYLAVMKSSRGAKRWHYLELHRLYYSHPSAVKLSTWICFTGRIYLPSGTCFNYLASL